MKETLGKNIVKVLKYVNYTERRNVWNFSECYHFQSFLNILDMKMEIFVINLAENTSNERNI